MKRTLVRAMQTLWSIWSLISCICGLCSYSVLDPFGPYNHSYPSFRRLSELHLIFAYDIHHLLLPIAEWSIIDDDYARLQSISIAEYHYESCHWYFFLPALFSPILDLWAFQSQVPDLPSNHWQCHARTASPGMGVLLVRPLVGNSHRFCTILFQNILQEDNL